MRNAWVKVSNVDKSLTVPYITIEPATPNGEGSWYKRTVNKETEVETETEVKVTISTTNNLAERIEYTAIGLYNKEETITTKTHGRIETSFTITGSGETTITATMGKGEYDSLPNIKTIKLDNIKPEITDIKITPEPGETDSKGKSWIRATGQITVEAEDSKDGNPGTGKVTGYEYTAKNLKTEEIKKTVKVEEITKGIDIINDGEYQVDIQAIDEAGNKSETSSINVYKDSKKPEVGELEITAENSDGFTMHLGATDETSGIGKVECTVNGEKIPDEQVTIDQITEAGVTFTVTGLDELSSYTIFVKVYDNAGNPSTATKEITGETIVAISAPVIKILNNDTWCNTTKTVEIPEVEGYKIIYTEDGTEPTATNGTEAVGTGTGKISFTIGTENATVKAIYVDIAKNTTSRVGQSSEMAKIDKTPPTVTITSIEGKKNSAVVEWNAEDNPGGSGMLDSSYYLSADAVRTSTLMGTNSAQITGLGSMNKVTTRTVTLSAKDMARK